LKASIVVLFKVKEDIKIRYLTAPTEVCRDASSKVVGLVVQHMELGDPDDSSRRRPIPIEGAVDEIEADTVIMVEVDLGPTAAAAVE
jgi:glutamate synthase (NADPH/NADH) small chain